MTNSVDKPVDILVDNLGDNYVDVERAPVIPFRSYGLPFGSRRKL